MESKKISTKLLLKSGFWYTASNFLTRAMVFITMPLFTRLMSKEQYGDFTVFASWQVILLVICGMEIYATLNRARFDYIEDGKLDGYISSSLLLSTAVTLSIFFAYLLFPHLFEKFFLIERKYMLILFAYLFTEPAFLMFQAKQRIEYKYKLCALITFSVSILSALLSILLVFTMPSDRLFGRLIGTYGLYVITGLGFYVFFLYKSHSISLSAWKYALRLGLPLVFSYLGSQVFLSSDNIVLKHMCSAEEVSYLSVTHSASHILLILVQTLNTAWAPWLFDMLKDGETKKIKNTFKIYMWAIVGITFAVLLIGPEIILILGGSQYMESIYILPANILSGVFTVLTANFVNVETYNKKTEYSGILTAVTALLNIGLNILCVKLWGYRAVCYTTIVCQVLLISCHYLCTIKMGIRELISHKDIIFVLGASLILIPTCLLLYQNNIIRYVFVATIFVAAGAIAFVKRNEIKRCILNFKNNKT